MRVLDLLRSQPALVLFLVIGVGSVLGKLRVAGVQLGASTGVLLGGLLLGHLGLHGSGASQSIGFMLFMYCVGLRAGPQFLTANVGLEAGGSVVSALQSTGPSLLVAGLIVMAVPVLVGFAVGRWMLGLDSVVLLGALTGAMTSTPALDTVNRQAESTLPTVGYAGTYAFANVLLATAGSLLMRL